MNWVFTFCKNGLFATRSGIIGWRFWEGIVRLLLLWKFLELEAFWEFSAITCIPLSFSFLFLRPMRINSLLWGSAWRNSEKYLIPFYVVSCCRDSGITMFPGFSFFSRSQSRFKARPFFEAKVKPKINRLFKKRLRTVWKLYYQNLFIAKSKKGTNNAF